MCVEAGSERGTNICRVILRRNGSKGQGSRTSSTWSSYFPKKEQRNCFVILTINYLAQIFYGDLQLLKYDALIFFFFIRNFFFPFLNKCYSKGFHLFWQIFAFLYTISQQFSYLTVTFLHLSKDDIYSLSICMYLRFCV